MKSGCVMKNPYDTNHASRKKPKRKKMIRSKNPYSTNAIVVFKY